VVIACGDTLVVRLVAVDRPPQPQCRARTLNGKLQVPESLFEPLLEDELARWEGGS
jgi:hypothetical protein